MECGWSVDVRHRTATRFVDVEGRSDHGSLLCHLSDTMRYCGPSTAYRSRCSVGARRTRDPRRICLSKLLSLQHASLGKGGKGNHGFTIVIDGLGCVFSVG